MVHDDVRPTFGLVERKQLFIVKMEVRKIIWNRGNWNREHYMLWDDSYSMVTDIKQVCLALIRRKASEIFSYFFILSS